MTELCYFLVGYGRTLMAHAPCFCFFESLNKPSKVCVFHLKSFPSASAKKGF